MAVSIYLDASVIVALFTKDYFTDRATSLLASKADVVIVSDFAAVEFSSVIARFVRTRSVTVEQARAVLSDFDSWSERACQRVATDGAVISRAEVFLRRMDTPLRTADAINIAIAEGLRASLMTFDEKMSAAARVLGLPLVTPSHH
jgi:predicted nucleic acid-binding protein